MHRPPNNWILTTQDGGQNSDEYQASSSYNSEERKATQNQYFVE